MREHGDTRVFLKHRFPVIKQGKTSILLQSPRRTSILGDGGESKVRLVGRSVGGFVCEVGDKRKSSFHEEGSFTGIKWFSLHLGDSNNVVQVEVGLSGRHCLGTTTQRKDLGTFTPLPPAE